MMFDFSPKEDVPWFDGSLAKLYEYFENTPEVWADAGEFMKVTGFNTSTIVRLHVCLQYTRACVYVYFGQPCIIVNASTVHAACVVL